MTRAKRQPQVKFVHCWIRDQAVLYKSVDTVLEPNEAVSGFLPHVLQLKIGVPIILLRNINPPKLCNGTRLAVKKKQWKT